MSSVDIDPDLRLLNTMLAIWPDARKCQKRDNTMIQLDKLNLTGIQTHIGYSIIGKCICCQSHLDGKRNMTILERAESVNLIGTSANK